jgi:hypothetical protein
VNRYSNKNEQVWVMAVHFSYLVLIILYLATISEPANALDSKGMRPISSMTPKEIRMEKLSIWKNILVICLSFMCLFTAFNSMANLQSSINSTAGLGNFLF